MTTVTFSNFNLSPKLDEDTFTAKVPDGYERIRLARRDSDLAPVETADADRRGCTRRRPRREPLSEKGSKSHAEASTPPVARAPPSC